MNISAVILSASPIEKQIEGVEVLAHVSRFSDAEGLLEARAAAVRKVKTPWFFFLDDDDELPADYLRVLRRCMDAGVPLAYTHELVREEGKPDVVRRSEPYSQALHQRTPLLVHHLAVWRTADATAALERLPRGTYAIEPLLGWELAKGGTALIDEVGYIWNRSKTGLSRHPSLQRGLVRSLLWGRDHP